MTLSENYGKWNQIRVASQKKDTESVYMYVKEAQYYTKNLSVLCVIW